MCRPRHFPPARSRPSQRSTARSSSSHARVARRSSASGSTPAALASSTRRGAARRRRRSRRGPSRRGWSPGRRPARRARPASFAARASARDRAGRRRARRRALLGLLELVPAGLDGLGVGRVRPRTRAVPRDELRRGAARDVVEVEGRCGVLLGEAGVEDDLQQHVPELFEQVLAAARLDCLDELVRLLDDVRQEALVRLLAVPRAAARGAQAVHDCDRLGDPLERGAREAVTAPGRSTPASWPRPSPKEPEAG